MRERYLDELCAKLPADLSQEGRAEIRRELEIHLEALIDARLDLHGMRQREAHSALEQVLAEALTTLASFYRDVLGATVHREYGGTSVVLRFLEGFSIQETAKITGYPFVTAQNKFEALAARGFAAIPRDAVWLICIVHLAGACAELRDERRAPDLYELLLPYGGRLVVVDRAWACWGAVCFYLADIRAEAKRAHHEYGMLVLAGAGIVGLAVGFGAQNLVRDLISGFFLVLENQVRVGDVAVVNGTGGLVEAITFRTIVLRDVEELGNDEAAQILGESVASVKSRLHRARMELRERMEKHWR